MANEMFTTRSGKQVPIPDMFIPKSILTSAMRLQEDLNKGTGKYTLKYVVVIMLARGERSIRASLKQRAKTKTAKAVNAYIQTQLALGQPIDRNYVAKLNGVMATDVELEEEDTVLDGEIDGTVEAELSDEELEAATDPNVQ